MTSKIAVRTVPALLALLVAALPAAADEERVAELERRIEVLAQEIEQIRLGGVADTIVPGIRSGLGPAASKVYAIPRGVSIGGYGEMLYENFDRARQDGMPSGKLDRLDFLRQVFYVGYKFHDALLFNSEIEIEHGGVRGRGEVRGESDPATGKVRGEAELTGEVVLEFAYLEWVHVPAFGLRAGLMLVPLGIVNELHEPPVFFGARRPEVEQRIIPTTWRANGVGLFGELASGISYRLYLTEGLDASGFTASGGIRGGRQSGSRSLLTRPAWSARADYAGAPGVTAGASVFAGDAWQTFQPASSEIAARLTLADLHARLQWRSLEARALYAHGTVSDAGALSDALGLAGSGRLGKRFWGAYGELAYDVLPGLARGTSAALLPYVRIERYDTQEEVPGGSEDPALSRRVVTAGAAFRPHPQVVIKADRQWRRNDARTDTGQWNAALGYVF